MERSLGLAGYHPAAAFLYFALVLFFSMFLMHPVCLLLSLGCALAYALQLTSLKEVLGTVKWLLPVGLAAAVINTLFNSRGATILTRLPWGYVTLESLLYGLAAGAMLGAVMLWFRCASEVLTADKTVFLFGRWAPSLALLLSMALRFLPQFQRRLTAVREAQRCLGNDPAEGTLREKLRSGAAALSTLITWSLESALDTADSMKARGHGLPGRSSFSVYTLARRDKVLLGWLALLGGVLLWGLVTGRLGWRYYPRLRGGGDPLMLGVYLLLCVTPIALERKEARAWASSGLTV